MTARTRRWAAAGALVIVIAAGLLVHGMAGSVATDVAGDALYTFAAYAFVVVLAPGLRPAAVALIAIAWCFAIEFLQLTTFPATAAGILPVSRLVLGSGFDPRDLVVYAVAALVAGAADAGLRRVARSRQDAQPPR